MTWHQNFTIPRKPGLQFFSFSTFLGALIIPRAHNQKTHPFLQQYQTLSKNPHTSLSPFLSPTAMPKASTVAKPADSRLKRKGAGTGTKQSKKASKDPNRPKRPPSAFFVFMSEFRETFKKENPNNKSVAVVGKAGGKEWKSLSTADKAPYVERAEKLKEEYEKTLRAYNIGLAEGKTPSEEEGSDKSKSEVNDDDEDDDEDDE
ncbi:high mobility group B protein 2-like [Cicer arietinum]|uniref:HMG1/2-like protein isoform X2 n=1 Tax=Cicer arietinum TaxID=3827 RepID=A0A1S2YZ92_CICAR|nr:HMG1/2-like protein isoform X2 [Cicer arietinum]